MEGLIQVRLLEARDVEPVLSLQARCPEAAQWERKVYENLAEPSFRMETSERVVVAECDAQVAGFLAFRRVADEVEVTNLAVLPGARRRGIGSKLMETAMAVGTCSDSRMFVEVRASNAGAIAFYERHGFAVTGRRPRYYRDPEEDAVLMSRAPR